MTLTRLVVIGPVPPPVHGVTLSTTLVLANRLLQARFDVEHLDTSDHRHGQNLGRWDARNVVLGIRHVGALVGRLRGPRGLVYLPLSQSSAGLLRDLLFVDYASLRGWRVAAHLRGGEFPEVYRAQRAAFRAWIRASLRRIDALAVMGESLRPMFDGLVTPERIAVVPNGTPDSAYVEGRKDGPVLFLSNLRRRKGVVEALEAAIRVIQAERTARFQFVGEWEDPDLERRLKERARPYPDRIDFRPAVTGEAKEELLQQASMLLFPPIQPEGHPRVVLEALAAGLPVVTTDQGAIAESVGDGKSGFVLPVSDPVQLADRVLALLRDSELRERMSRAARDRYLEQFTQERADRVLADWLTSVSGGPTATNRGRLAETRPR